MFYAGLAWHWACTSVPSHVPVLQLLIPAIPTPGGDDHADRRVGLDPLAFQWHPEVWLLVAFLTGAYVYMVRVIGPKAVPRVSRPSRPTLAASSAAMAMLWIASDWPMHDIGEQYLYSVHMLQHMMLSYFLPPLVLLATPSGCCGCSSATAGSTGSGGSAGRSSPRSSSTRSVIITHIPGS
jgi:hypothetical protein